MIRDIIRKLKDIDTFRPKNTLNILVKIIKKLLYKEDLWRKKFTELLERFQIMFRDNKSKSAIEVTVFNNLLMNSISNTFLPNKKLFIVL